MSFKNHFNERIILPFSDCILNQNIYKSFNFLQKSQWWDETRIYEFQNFKLCELIEFSYKNVPYYNNLFNKIKLKPSDILSVDDLFKIPILTKEIIRNNFPHNITTTNFPKRHKILQGSSGSTGQPLQYFQSKTSYSLMIACGLRGWYWMNFRLGDKYIKLSTNPRVGLIKKSQDIINNCIYVHSQSLSSKDIIRFINILSKHSPVYVRGYPAALTIISKYILKNKITDFRTLAINTTSEPLFPHMRDIIESAFNCLIFDGYSAEGGPPVFECSTHETYHISAEYGILEIVDGNNSVNLEKGNIVTTDLWNYAMPFIRYNSKDIGFKSNRKCSCGRYLPTIDKIEGRDTDVFITPNGKYLTFYYFAGYFEWLDSVEMFQLNQVAQDEIFLNLIINEKFNSNIHKQIRKDMINVIGNDVNLIVKIVNDIPLTKSGKRRFFLRSFE